MIDFDILKSVGTTNARLKEIFTAVEPSNVTELPKEDQDKIAGDIKTRKFFEEEIQHRLSEHIYFSLKNHRIYSAVDLAWDSVPINDTNYPLMLYAQGKLDLGACATELSKIQGSDKYISKNDKGEPIGLDLPKFHEVTVNLVRSVITRRLAAQSNKYSNLFPFYKFESRSTGMIGKLRADVMSQIADIMCDSFGYRTHDIQVFRDALLYAFSIDFVRSSWEREMQWEREAIAEELDDKEIKKVAAIVKEGVAFVNPHPSRVFWDNSFPISSINTDSGCEYLGFWDVARYRDVANNPMYWNRDRITYSSNITTLFSSYAQYFSQYYTNIRVPSLEQSASDLSSSNDRVNNIGLYSTQMPDSSMILANYYRKIVPKEFGIGDYPYPVWVRFVVAGDNTVIFSEILGSTPGAVCAYNFNESRQVNISMAHELMSYQDHLTNLFSYLLLCIKSDNQKVLVLDIDTLTPEQIKVIREQAKGRNAQNETMVLEVSRSKLNSVGLNPDSVVKLIETRPTAAINIILEAISRLLQMVERLMALSPQEQGQPAPREISATETNLIAGTTESVYGFISDAFDEFRDAKKRIIYESYMAFGNPDLKVPVTNRFSKQVIEKAGFNVVDEDAEGLDIDDGTPYRHTVIGSKEKLLHQYIFTSRDGAERASNSQAANTLVQLLQIIQNPLVAQDIGKERLFGIINEIFRLSGAGVDLKIELQEGESDKLGVPPEETQKLQQVLAQLTQIVEKNQQDIASLQQQIQQFIGGGAIPRAAA